MTGLAAVTGFSRRPDDVAAARQFLVGIARNSEARLPTYGQVADVYGGIPRAVGAVLNSISRDCEHAGEPDLTALVIDQQTHLPGSFNEAPVEPGSLNESRWKDELVRIRTYDWPLE